jgi:hypothetical protein
MLQKNAVPSLLLHSILTALLVLGSPFLLLSIFLGLATPAPAGIGASYETDILAIIGIYGIAYNVYGWYGLVRNQAIRWSSMLWKPAIFALLYVALMLFGRLV